MDIIDRINALLKEKGMSGADLSRAIGVSNAVYSQWNCKRTKPSIRNLAKIAAVLDVPVGYLLTGKQENPPPEGDGREDAEFLALIHQMSEQERAEELAYLRARVARKGKPSAPQG